MIEEHSDIVGNPSRKPRPGGLTHLPLADPQEHLKDLHMETEE